MILRSSSNPVPVTPLSDSPDSDFHDHNKLPSSHDFHRLNLTPVSSTNPSSPISQHNQESKILRLRGLRKAWSDSNLEKFVFSSFSSHHQDELLQYSLSHTPKKFTNRNYTNMLHSAPSFSVFNVDDPELQDRERNGADEESGLRRTVTIGDRIETRASGEFSFGKKSMGLIEEGGGEEEEEQDQGGLNGFENLNLEQVKEPVSPPMYLASGVGTNGIDFGGSGGGGFESSLPNFDENGDLEEYYKRMVDEFPSHPLFLANCAQLLQTKGDLHAAENYYHRATLADPEDGQILIKYAQLDWQLNHDEARALRNFERAVQAAPQDSHVLAAYASFLWELDDEEEEISQLKHIQDEEESLTELEQLVNIQDLEPLSLPPGLIVDVGDNADSATKKGCNAEEEYYYKKMVEENPSNSLVLRNYARFLHQFKGDLQGAEEYYSRAALADPGDGEIKSLYAKLVWELHRDHDKALTYFEQAVQASPHNSHVIAAYACFLWETEENEEVGASSDQFRKAIHNESSVSAARA